MREQKGRPLIYYLFFTMLVSSFVMIEPAPYDLLMILLVIGCLLFAQLKFSEESIFPLLLLCIFLICSLISMFFAVNTPTTIKYSATTIYLVLVMVCLVCLGDHIKQLLPTIYKGYLMSAVIVTILGILAYFNTLPFSDELLLFGRVKSTFKDPNVFGPYLVLPALFAISMIEMTATKPYKKVFYFLCFLLLGAGVTLSFSRAAWGNFALSLFIYFLFTKKEFLKKKMKIIVALLVVAIPLFIHFIQTPFVQDLFSSRLSLKNYDAERFSTQKASFELGIQKPLGIGPGQSEFIFQYSPHSLYARVFTENGLLGFTSLIFFLSICIYRAFKSYRNSSGEASLLFAVAFSSLVGLAFNSLFIDTLHWRHLWLILSFSLLPSIQNTEKPFLQNSSRLPKAIRNMPS